MKIPALQKQYDGRMVLDTPELTMEKGKLYALLGAMAAANPPLPGFLPGLFPPTITEGFRRTAAWDTFPRRGTPSGQRF